jgi:thiamine-phosphate pyrophosphorylase
MIIVITDRKISATRDFLDHVEAIANTAPDMIILREKDLSEAGYKYLAIECQRICSYHNIKFCVNTFLRTAVSLESERIQVSFDLLKTNTYRLKDFNEIWVSVHSLGEAVEAESLGATHLIYGNVFETSCKPGAAGKGIVELKRVCGAVRIPVFAVGGIDQNTIEKAIDAGCEGVCVRSLFMQSLNPRVTMDELRERINKG